MNEIRVRSLLSRVTRFHLLQKRCRRSTCTLSSIKLTMDSDGRPPPSNVKPETDAGPVNRNCSPSVRTPEERGGLRPQAQHEDAPNGTAQQGGGRLQPGYVFQTNPTHFRYNDYLEERLRVDGTVQFDLRQGSITVDDIVFLYRCGRENPGIFALGKS